MSTTNGTFFNFSLQPTPAQYNTIYWIIGFSFAIFILGLIPVAKYILWPFKILTVALHEFSHAFAGMLTGAKIVSISVEPNEGGLTKMKGGNPYYTLPAGYIGSNFFGAAMIFAGFSDSGSKVVAVIVSLCLLLTLFYARRSIFTVATIVIALGLFALLYWIENSKFLRYYVLFLGTMSALYSLWDILEDLVLRKVNESDATQYSKICCAGALSPKVWGVIWFVISFLVATGACLAAILVFPDPSSRGF